MNTLSRSHIDDLTSMMWVYFMRKTYEVFYTFKKLKVLVEKQSDKFIKVLRTDKEKEYVSNEFKKFCEDERVEK